VVTCAQYSAGMAAHVSESRLVTLDTTAIPPTRLQICQTKESRRVVSMCFCLLPMKKLTYQDEIVPRLGCTALFFTECVDAIFE
jgi:hypothetical protein